MQCNAMAGQERAAELGHFQKVWVAVHAGGLYRALGPEGQSVSQVSPPLGRLFVIHAYTHT